MTFKTFYKKHIPKLYSFLVILTTLASYNSSRFRKNLLERTEKLIITIGNEIKDEKLQYHINREAGNISALSSGKTDKHKFLTGEEILPSDQNRIAEWAKVTYSPLGKEFEKQIKTIEDQRIQQVEALNSLTSEENQEIESVGKTFPKKMGNNKVKHEIDVIKKWEEKIKNNRIFSWKYLYW